MGINNCNTILNREIQNSTTFISQTPLEHEKVHVYIDALIYVITPIRMHSENLQKGISIGVNKLMQIVKWFIAYTSVYEIIFVWDGTAPLAKSFTQHKRRENTMGMYVNFDLAFKQIIDMIEDECKGLNKVHLFRSFESIEYPNIIEEDEEKKKNVPENHLIIQNLKPLFGEGESIMVEKRNRTNPCVFVSTDTDLFPLLYKKSTPENPLYIYDIGSNRLIDMGLFENWMEPLPFQYLMCLAGCDFYRKSLSTNACIAIINAMDIYETIDSENVVIKKGTADWPYEYKDFMKYINNVNNSTTAKDAVFHITELLHWLYKFSPKSLKISQRGVKRLISDEILDLFLKEMDWVVEYWNKGSKVEGYRNNIYKGRILGFNAESSISVLTNLRKHLKFPNDLFAANNKRKKEEIEYEDY